MKQSEQDTFQSFRRQRAAAVVAVLVMFAICWTVRGQKLEAGEVKQGTACGPNPRPPVTSRQTPGSAGQTNTISESISWRLDLLDEKTASDLFGKQFNRKFLIYRLCLANRGKAPKAGRSTLYLIQDFLRIPVTISSEGQPLTTAQIQVLSKHPEFENLGFSELGNAGSNHETKGLCESANAFYRPFTPEQLIDRKIYLQLGRLEIAKSKLVKLDGYQRRNVLTFVLKPMEKLSSRQSIERILVVPEDEAVGSHHIRIVPCLSYFRFAMIIE